MMPFSLYLHQALDLNFACSRISNANEVQNGIAFVIRGFVTKASFAQAAGAVAFISYDYQNNSARILNMLPDESSTKVWIPCAFMQGSHAQHLLGLMELENKTYLDVDFPVDRTECWTQSTQGDVH
ncbi:hypothetical protein TcWFU_002833 [Taenia crassiceps]|uniref:PA domain-containing protein n=1 Tax=Taenia crassiceps TaxID=6207 RepID=A0ABR4QPB2_9CEST